MTTPRTRRSNLRKLADYLSKLPEGYSDFQMAHYFSAKSGEITSVDFAKIEREYALKNGGVGKCGAVACALGHGPSAGILFRNDDFGGEFYPNDAPNWSVYGERFLANEDKDLFEFLFGGGWSAFDNTPQGAAKRIRFYLSGEYKKHPSVSRYNWTRWMELYKDA